MNAEYWQQNTKYNQPTAPKDAERAQKDPRTWTGRLGLSRSTAYKFIIVCLESTLNILQLVF